MRVLDEDAPSAANEPLIREDASDDGHADPHPGVDEAAQHAERDLPRPSRFVWTLTFAAGISGLLFGYDTGVISATLVSIDHDLSDRLLTTLDKSLITASTSLFALIASPVAGWLADRMGRKGVILVADGLFIAGSAWQAVTGSVAGMVAGRSVVGLAIGGASLVVPLYIGELSPSPFRGRLVTLSILFITIGQMVSYLVGYLLSTRAHGWRWMVGLGALPAAIQIFLLLAFLPESPRWLVKATRETEARSVLDQVYGQDTKAIVGTVMNGIKQEIREEELATERRVTRRTNGKPARRGTQWLVDSCGELFLVQSNRRALAIACLIQGLQQLCGFNSLMYFSATIFALVGFTTPTLPSLSIAITNFIFTLLALVLIDRIGRRRMLLSSIPLMVVGLVFSAITFGFIDVAPSSASGTSSDRQPALSIWPFPLLLLLSTTLYVAAYALGLGNIAWQQAELFPLSVRSQGSGIATATNWGCNFIVGVTFLPMMEWLTPGGAFVVYALICAGGWWAVRKWYPERGGQALEDVGRITAAS